MAEALNRTRKLKDIYVKANNKIHSESKETVIKHHSTTSHETNFNEMDKTNTGANTNGSAVIGSSVISMHFDLPGILALTRRIEEETKNAKNIRDFSKKVLGLGKNYKNLLDKDSSKRAAAKKIIESNRKARGVLG